MKIFQEEDRFVLTNLTSQASYSALVAEGWSYDQKRQVFYTQYIPVLFKWRNYCDNFIKNKIALLEQQYKQSFYDQSPEGFDISFECGNLYEYQKFGIWYISTRKNVMIADEMGLGKTIQVIGYMKLASQFKKVLIICPASLTFNWKSELNKWLPEVDNIKVWSSKELSTVQDIDNEYINIVSYNAFTLHDTKFTKHNWDLLICDEAHYLKNRDSQRTRAVCGIPPRTGNVRSLRKGGIRSAKNVFLTGTPLTSTPQDFYSMFSYLFQDIFFISYTFFMARYCGQSMIGAGRRPPIAPQNLDELNFIARSAGVLRRTKQQVLLQLPSKQKQAIILAPFKGIKLNSSLFSDFKEIENMEEFKYESDEHIATYRKQLGLSKVSEAIEHIENILNDGIEKLVVFACHREVLDQLFKKFEKIAVKIDGSTSNEQRFLNVEKFQNDPGIKLFFGNIKAAGAGITLTAANHALFVEVDWNPANMQQAEDRIHRIGQSKNVLIQYLVNYQSLDHRIVQINIDKKDTQQKSLDIVCL